MYPLPLCYILVLQYTVAACVHGAQDWRKPVAKCLTGHVACAVIYTHFRPVEVNGTDAKQTPFCVPVIVEIQSVMVEI